MSQNIRKNIGPAYKDVAAKYENTEENVKMLATKVIKGGSGVWGAVPMTPHPQISQEDAEAMVKYVLLLKSSSLVTHKNQHHAKTIACSSVIICLYANQRTKKEWTSLFDGKTTSGWHTYGKDAVGEAWKVVDGTLMLDPSQKEGWQIKGGGDIVSNESYGDFHLQLEWKISKNGNSGIIFFIQDEPKNTITFGILDQKCKC